MEGTTTEIKKLKPIPNATTTRGPGITPSHFDWFPCFKRSHTTKRATDTVEMMMAVILTLAWGSHSDEYKPCRQKCERKQNKPSSGLNSPRHPIACGNCLKAIMIPIPANMPLITLEGKNVARSPARIVPRAIWSIPDRAIATKSPSRPPSFS